MWLDVLGVSPNGTHPGCGQEEARSYRLFLCVNARCLVPRARFVAQPGMKCRGQWLLNQVPKARHIFTVVQEAFANNLPCLWHYCFLLKLRPGIFSRVGNKCPFGTNALQLASTPEAIPCEFQSACRTGFEFRSH